MNRIFLILLLTSSLTTCFTKDIVITNKTNANGGWKARIESEGKFITNFRNMYRKDSKVTFRNLNTQNGCTIQIQSIRKIGKGTAMSSSYITLRKDDNSRQNLTVEIRECDFNKNSCKNIEKEKDDQEEEVGKENIYYYVE